MVLHVALRLQNTGSLRQDLSLGGDAERNDEDWL